MPELYMITVQKYFPEFYRGSCPLPAHRLLRLCCGQPSDNVELNVPSECDSYVLKSGRPARHRVPIADRDRSCSTRLLL